VSGRYAHRFAFFGSPPSTCAPRWMQGWPSRLTIWIAWIRVAGCVFSISPVRRLIAERHVHPAKLVSTRCEHPALRFDLLIAWMPFLRGITRSIKITSIKPTLSTA
jgi:hypothetical protein